MLCSLERVRCRGRLLPVVALALLWASPQRAAAQLPLGNLIVAVSAPAGGSTVGGTVAVNATVTAIGQLTVSSVQFTLDGVDLGAADTTAPYTVGWDTRAALNGPHTLRAVARDVLGLPHASDPVMVTVFNDTTAPVVAITAPQASATVHGQIDVAASATDEGGVAGVQFRLDGAALGAEDTTAPYSVPWDTIASINGTHTVTAEARDVAGNRAAAAAVVVTVRNDSAPPAVSLTAPQDGTVVSGTVAIGADASDDLSVAGVTFLIDGMAIAAENTTAPYATSWDTAAAANGAHTITARARDEVGKTTTSAAVSVTVRNDSGPPAVSVTAPQAGVTVGGTVTIDANASDDLTVAGVTFLVDGTAIAAEDTSAPYTASWDTTTYADGAHAITAVARDEVGKTTTSAAITVTVSNFVEAVTRIEESAAAVSYTGDWILGYTGGRPWSGGTAALGYAATHRARLAFSGTAVSWTGFRGPQVGIARVHLDGAVVATVDGYAAAEEVGVVLYAVGGLPPGPHTLEIEVTRTKNDAASDFFVVVDAFDVTAPAGPDTTPPSVTITAPVGGASVAGVVSLAANASDNVAVSHVRFFADGAEIGEDHAAPYSVSWNTAVVPDGSHTLTAVARDGAGNTATSAAVTVFVANAPPPPGAVTTRIENNDPAVTYADGTTAPGRPAGWWHGSRSRSWSNDTSSFNRSAGARATLRFTGTMVRWIGFRAYWAGIARVSVDGGPFTELDLFLPPCTPEQRAQGCRDEEPQAVVFTASGLAPDVEHTLAIESTGRKRGGETCTAGPDCAQDYAVVVDAVEVGPAFVPAVIGRRVDELDPAVTLSGTWQSDADAAYAWSGGTAAVSTATGSRATITFAEKSLHWLGRFGPDGGIARIYLDGAFHAEVDTYAPAHAQGLLYAATNLAAGTHTLAIEVTGRKNTRAGGHAIVFDAADVRSRVEETDVSVVYSVADPSARWVPENADKAWSGTSANNGTGTAARSTTAGARAEIAFAGTGVRWIGYRGPAAGIAEVFVDGIPAGQVDLYSPVEEVRAAVFERTNLAAGAHTLRIDVTGQRNPSATNSVVIVDAFDLTLAPPLPATTRVQENQASVSAGAGWITGSRFEFWTGEQAIMSDTPAAQATFTFTGTSVRWVGERRRTGGIARVSIDGVFVAEVDTFASLQDEFQAALFTRSDLAPGTHTVTIEVTGRKRGGDACSPSPAPDCSGGYAVVIDAFDTH